MRARHITFILGSLLLSLVVHADPNVRRIVYEVAVLGTTSMSCPDSLERYDQSELSMPKQFVDTPGGTAEQFFLTQYCPAIRDGYVYAIAVCASDMDMFKRKLSSGQFTRLEVTNARLIRKVLSASGEVLGKEELTPCPRATDPSAPQTPATKSF